MAIDAHLVDRIQAVVEPHRSVADGLHHPVKVGGGAGHAMVDHCIAHAFAQRVLHGHLGEQHQTDFNGGKNQQQKQWREQRELNQGGAVLLVMR